MIDKYNIQKLRELDILQVADLLGMGLRNKRALCIHHDDHHPSLAFNVKKNTCHCYSCGFSADTIALVRERLNLGFSEACHWLADHFDVYIGDDRYGNSAKYGNSARYADKCADKKVLTASDRRMASLRAHFAETHVSHGHVATASVDVEFYQQMFRQMHLSESGRRFLFEERLLSPEALKVCHIVSTEQSVCMARVGRGMFDGPSLIFPYFDQEGRLVSVQSRYLGKKKSESSSDMDKVSLDEAKPDDVKPDDVKPKEIPRFKFAPGSHRMIYGLDRLKDYPPDEPLLITEGPSDCWTALTLGIHAIAIPSATLFDRRFQGLLAGRNLHIFPDQDEAGLSLYFELKQALPSLVYHQLPEGCKDLSEYYLKLRRSEGMTLEEAKAKVQGCVSV
ncbi:CHC2 zinc finger domain-containing protein [Segatella copri]|uniref:CHC2 zinc finger domain-containing protein n=1 Tax=Segatella copri TaxID=165179 RepID=UPI001F3445E3|nr:CHC2 zinc finger domain-containing protein [Segatella copri]